MSKYKNVYDDIYSVFATPAWVAEAIKAIPENYLAKNLGTEYLRLDVITSGNHAAINIPGAVSGQLMVSIYVPAGQGALRLLSIADTLDKHLSRKSISTRPSSVTQFAESALIHLGVDKSNGSLYRGSYSISFNYFGN